MAKKELGVLTLPQLSDELKEVYSKITTIEEQLEANGGEITSDEDVVLEGLTQYLNDIEVSLEEKTDKMVYLIEKLNFDVEYLKALKAKADKKAKFIEANIEKIKQRANYFFHQIDIQKVKTKLYTVATYESVRREISNINDVPFEYRKYTLPELNNDEMNLLYACLENRSGQEAVSELINKINTDTKVRALVSEIPKVPLIDEYGAIVKDEKGEIVYTDHPCIITNATPTLKIR